MNDERSPRVPSITSREQLPESQRQAFDRIEASRGRVIGPFTVLLNSPEVAERVARVGAYVRFESTIPDLERELAILTTARERDCAFEWATHEPIASDAGVKESAMEAVATREPVDGLSTEEATVVRYVRELLRADAITDATFEAAADRFGTQGVIDLTATVGYYSMLASVLNAFEVLPDEGEPTLP